MAVLRRWWMGVAAVLALVAALVAVAWLRPGYRDGPAAPAARDPRRWPFAASSIWNMPVGRDAVLVRAELVLPRFYGAEENVIVMVPDAPLRPVYRAPDFGSSNRERCATVGEEVYRLPIPDGFATVGAGGLLDEGTPNAAAAVLRPDGRTVAQTQPLAVCCEGIVTTVFDKPDGDLEGDGIAGAQGGSGLSSLGGALRLGELTPDRPTIRHALKITLDAATNLSFAGGGFRWPASKADAYASPATYRGANPEVRLGSLLVLPDAGALDLETDPARAVAEALERYGAYVVDDAAQPAVNIAVEHSPDGRFVDQFTDDWGFAFVAESGPWKRDLDTIIAALHVVTDNTPETIGGAGRRRACYAPPFTGRPLAPGEPSGCP
jgi:hypothetical protein